MTATPLPSLHTTACFLVVCVASSTLAEYCRKAKLPLITGYILAGIVCGPCVLSLLSRPASEQLSALINDDAMGFIGFSAGSKFLLSELRGQMRPVLCLLTGLVGTTYLLVGCGVWFASPWLSLTSDATTEQRVAVALIVACLAVARSPSSAIALVSELDAHGALTTSLTLTPTLSLTRATRRWATGRCTTCCTTPRTWATCPSSPSTRCSAPSSTPPRSPRG